MRHNQHSLNFGASYSLLPALIYYMRNVDRISTLHLLLSWSSRRVVRSFQIFPTGTSSRRKLRNRATRMMSTSRKTPLIDVDCNLWHKDLQPLFPVEHTVVSSSLDILDQDAVFQSNIIAVISPSSTLKEATTGLSILRRLYASPQSGASSLPLIKTTIGIHPYHVNDDGPLLSAQMESCEKLVSEHRDYVVAIGECGLDASDGFPPIEEQIPWFREQIALADRLQLPLFVHERLAFNETMELLAETTAPVIIHCFTGNIAECQAYMQRGYYISFSGYICKENSEPTVECLSCPGVIPLDRLMIETDAPYMGFPGCRDLYLKKNAKLLNGLNAKKRKK